jgi:hypothetical protein
MGLDISAYSNLKREDDQSKNRDDYEIRIWINPNFPGRCDDVAEGYYTSEEDLRFGAGSYSGYNAWRDQLARLAGHADARAVWNDPKSGPFVELINFSDCFSSDTRSTEMPFTITITEQKTPGEAANEVFRQTVEVLDLPAVFNAVNKKKRKPRETTKAKAVTQ